jgi:serine/threonine protein kinase
MDEFDILGKIGEGGFGVVSKALHKRTGNIVALKRVGVSISQGIPEKVFREIKVLQLLTHDNLVSLLDFFLDGTSMVLVFEYVPHNLSGFLAALPHPLGPGQVKCIMRMILLGLHEIHRIGVMHRDIKPSNILLTQEGVVKVADFGLAKMMVGDGSHTPQIQSRWYRSPESLLGSRTYDTSGDMWSVGCVFCELLNNGVMFRGESDIDQLTRIAHSLGGMTEKEWAGIAILPDYQKIQISPSVPIPWEMLIPDASENARDFAQKLLGVNPSGRLSVEEALQHPYFFEFPLAVHHFLLPLHIFGDDEKALAKTEERWKKWFEKVS